MGYINFLTKLLNTSYLICMTIFFGLLGYLMIDTYLGYYESDEVKLFYNILFIVGILVYISLLSRLKNIIEVKIYKENYEPVLIPLIIQAVLYGVITPFAIVNYYVIYILITNNNSDFLKHFVKKDNKYYLSLILLNVGFIIYLIYMFVEYINILFNIFNKIINNNLEISFLFIFSFFMLIVWLVLIRVAIKLFNENKYLICAVISIVVGVLTNPFNIHSLCWITSGIMILVQDNNFDKLKDKAIELKNKVVKK